MSEPLPPEERWDLAALPPGVRAGTGTVITGRFAFRRLKSQIDPALVIGAHCTMDGAQFSAGPEGRISIGDYCYFGSAVLMAELEMRIGNYVVIGWNTNIADSDFHPLDPAQRIADAVACSPLGQGRARPEVRRLPVVIEDDVWIGPNVTILKGVRIGSGSWIEPGSLVTRDVPPRSRVLGNPAQVIGKV